MAYIPAQSQNQGLYVPTTNIWDVQELYAVDIKSEQFKELLVRLYQNVNNIALALNNKDSALYFEQEFVNAQLFFNPNSTDPNNQRQVFRKVINFGSLPNTATKTVAHGITFDANSNLTRLYGAATDPAAFTYIPLPYASPTLANNIELYLDGTNVNVITGSNRTNYTRSVVIIEWVKN